MWRGRGTVGVWRGRGTVGMWLSDGEEVWLALESAIDELTSQLLMRLWYSTDVMMDSDPMMLRVNEESQTQHLTNAPAQPNQSYE